MKEEIEAAARFLTLLVSRSNQSTTISEEQLQIFKRHLVRLFEERFHDHWFPERPQRGQGFRCIRLNGGSRPDPLIQQAATETGLEYRDLKLPVEFTMWVDPKEVSCRFGEHEGSYCTVASFGESGDSKTSIEGALPPLQVATDHERTLAPPQQSSPRRATSRSRLSPSPSSPPRVIQQQQHHQQYRLNCFYPNYESSHKGWYPMTSSASSFTSMSPPPPPMTMNYHTPKSRYMQQPQQHWGLAYVPTLRYLNNWPMGQMVKV